MLKLAATVMRRERLLCLFYFFCSAFSIYAQQPRLILPIGHTGHITSALFSPDGKKIVTGSDDGTSKLWDVETGALLADWRGHGSDWVTSAVFSPDGKKVLTTGGFLAKVWDVEQGSLLTVFKGHYGSLLSGVFSPDGTRILTASLDKTASIWDLKSGKALITLKGHTQSVEGAKYSTDGTRILTFSKDSTVRIWDAAKGGLLSILKGHRNVILSASFNSVGDRVITASADGEARVWDLSTGEMLFQLPHKNAVNSALFSPDDKMILTASSDSTVVVWDASTGGIIQKIEGLKRSLYAASFSPDGKQVVIPWGINRKMRFISSRGGDVIIWDLKTRSQKVILNGHAGWVYSAVYSQDGKKILTSSGDLTVKIWDAASAKLLRNFGGHTPELNVLSTNPVGNSILTAGSDQIARIWDLRTGKPSIILKGHWMRIVCGGFSSDGKTVVTGSDDNTARIWNTQTGKLLRTIPVRGMVYAAEFSSDGKKIITTSWSKSDIWDSETGQHLYELVGDGRIYTGGYSPDGRFFLTYESSGNARLWNVETGKLQNVFAQGDQINSGYFSPNGEKVITASSKGIVKVWDAKSGWALLTIKENYAVRQAVFTPDGKRIITASDQLRVWDSDTGNLLDSFRNSQRTAPSSLQFSYDGKKILAKTLEGVNVWALSDGALLAAMKIPFRELNQVVFSRNSNQVFTAGMDGMIEVWDISSSRTLYTFFSVDVDDFLTVDNSYRFDGSEAARKLLYFTCGTEVIQLDQVKDQLWVPNIVERINLGDSIRSKKLSELDICGLTPEVEDQTTSTGDYRFLIKPGKGGIGQTALLVNGIEVKRYDLSQLIKGSTGYELSIPRADLQPSLLKGQENSIAVKSYTADNSVFTRGLKVDESPSTAVSSIAPNLYAVMVGVSDYKGEELDLKYAAKDAKDIANALQVAARKLLNADGKEHVFMYDLTTSEKRDGLPEKINIRKVFEEIGKKAMPNDILMIFFAGHGVMEGEKKQFYFLTSDASASTASAAVKEVGISTDELTEWMKPQNIRAQKRILIFDACNSGQAIKDFVQMGGNNQGYLAARGDEQGQLVKAIDKLNERSGLFILSASASNQSAYEMGRYAQGLLTYSLLKAIKEQSDILDQGRYLDLSRWFHAAEQTVMELTRETGARQQPQIVSNTNFNIGVVDAEVRAGIRLPQEKPLFTGCNLQNADENIASDDLGLNMLLNAEFQSISVRGGTESILFTPGIQSADAWTLGGRYEVKGKSIAVRLNIRQGSNLPKYKFELSGSADDLKGLSRLIADRAAIMVGNKSN